MSQRAVYPPGLDSQAIPRRLSPSVISNGHLFLTGMTGSAPDGIMPRDPKPSSVQLSTRLRGCGMPQKRILGLWSK